MVHYLLIDTVQTYLPNPLLIRILILKLVTIYIKDGVEYNMESLQGKTFAYKGNIIAVAKRAIPNTAVTVNDEPAVDGDIAFKIKFKEKADSNELSDLVINSKLLGNDIKLK